jgi:hypothetical protein
MHIVVLPGDGIGPEITTATSGVLRAASERFQLNLGLEEHAVGHASLKQFGTTVRPELARCEDAAPPIEVAKAIGEGRATRDVGGNARHDRRGGGDCGDLAGWMTLPLSVFLGTKQKVEKQPHAQ